MIRNVVYSRNGGPVSFIAHDANDRPVLINAQHVLRIEPIGDDGQCSVLMVSGSLIVNEPFAEFEYWWIGSPPISGRVQL